MTVTEIAWIMMKMGMTMVGINMVKFIGPRCLENIQLQSDIVIVVFERFSTGTAWDRWTGCVRRFWRREPLSLALAFPYMGPGNLTAFLRIFNIPDQISKIDMTLIGTIYALVIWIYDDTPAVVFADSRVQNFLFSVDHSKPAKFAQFRTFSWISQHGLTISQVNDVPSI